MEVINRSRSRKSLILSSTCILLAIATFALGYANKLQMRLVQGGQPTYTITLNAANAPTSLSAVEFSDGSGTARYVDFDYTSARRQEGIHALLSVNGTIANNPNTKITSMKSLTAVFSGGIAELTSGPSLLLMNDTHFLTSGVTLSFENNPYYFCLANTGESDLELTSLVITYSCMPYYSTITYESNGGSDVDPMTSMIGSSVSAPDAPTRAGYTFAGWYSDETLTEEYTFTVMPDENLMLFAKWEFDADYPTMSIADFKALGEEDTSFHFVRGVVLLGLADMQIMVIADATGVLPVLSNLTVAHKDSIRVGGYRGQEGQLVILHGGAGEIDLGTYAHEQPIPLSPTTLSVAEYNALDPNVVATYFMYVEISGTIQVNQTTHQVKLVDGADEMSIFVINQESYNTILDYDNLRVKFRGVILPDMGGEDTALMLLFNGHEDFIDPDYSDAEMLVQLETMLRGYIETPDYFPGQFVDLPLTHPLFPVTVSYELFGDNADKFDLFNNFIDLNISVALDIDLHVTIAIIDGPSSTFDIALHVNPDLVLTIAEVRAMPDSQETTRITSGIVLNIGPMSENSSVVFIADATGVIHVNTNSTDVAVGDQIIVIGVKMTQNGMVYLFNDPSMTINRIVAHEQAFPLEATSSTLSAFIALEPSYVSASLVFYELTGTLAYTSPEAPESSMFVLSDSGVNVFIYPVDAAARTELGTHVGQVVTITGLAMVAGDPGSEAIVLFYIAFPGLIN